MARHNKKFFIQAAIKHPGALRRQLGAKDHIPLSKLKAAAKKGGTLGRRARLALTLRKLVKRKKKKRS